MSSDRGRLFNILTIVVLVATVCLAGFYGLVGLGVLEVFPPPTPAVVAQLPTSTPTAPIASIPTWTPTPPPTATAAGPPTDTPGPTLTPSTTPTLPPTLTPRPTATFAPTATPRPTEAPTARATRSAWPFTYQVRLRPGQYGGCSWTGVAGQVQDLDGNPLPGYPVHVWGAGIDAVVNAGADSRLNAMYGSDAAWEQYFGPHPKPIEVRVQLHDPVSEGHPPVSEEIVIELPGSCSTALGYVVFTQNH